MKRRETLRLIPLSIAGFVGCARKSFGYKTPSPQLKTDYTNSLAYRYTEKVKDMLAWIRETQSENMLEASYAVARTVKNGGQCWCYWDMGHSTKFDIFPERNGNPEIFFMGYDPKITKKGDLFLASIWSGPHEDLVTKEIFVIGGPAPWGGDAKGQELMRDDIEIHKMRPYSHIWIETNVTTLGAIMNVPGSYPPLGPVSGIIGITTFWMMMADTCRILARDGISVKMYGDESKLSGKNISWVGLHDPLMDDYFEQIMLQLDMIGAEYGEIRKVAEMAVDLVLSGGKVWCYSRYFDSLAVESHDRRGGLVLTRGIYEKDGKLTFINGNDHFGDTSKDIVIMGITKPDDAIDLKYMDKFRKLGMKIASIGPMTRDIKTPEGRTVPKESDIHIGRMMDTYGLYAIPGFEQKVCPTSGALTIQIFWSVCMEITEQIIHRTGNTPGIGLSGALKGVQRSDANMIMKYQERGY
ncbi:hypothetical protein ACFL47_05630 [Candidatus Latescibacterota bacterium]